MNAMITATHPAVAGQQLERLLCGRCGVTLSLFVAQPGLYMRSKCHRCRNRPDARGERTNAISQMWIDAFGVVHVEHYEMSRRTDLVST